MALVLVFMRFLLGSRRLGPMLLTTSTLTQDRFAKNGAGKAGEEIANESPFL
jgi:hypothetical protein